MAQEETLPTDDELDPHDLPRTNRAIGEVLTEEEADAFRENIARLREELGDRIAEHPFLLAALEELKEFLGQYERREVPS